MLIILKEVYSVIAKFLLSFLDELKLNPVYVKWLPWIGGNPSRDWKHILCRGSQPFLWTFMPPETSTLSNAGLYFYSVFSIGITPHLGDISDKLTLLNYRPSNIITWDVGGVPSPTHLIFLRRVLLSLLIGETLVITGCTSLWAWLLSFQGSGWQAPLYCSGGVGLLLALGTSHTHMCWVPCGACLCVGRS